ncbi:MAG TPA: NYN domain-containing protein [Thermoanaerobaculia bacterium]|nr:NYN domain-containing protein [Thermoanaerobaculia bacterium]
MAELIDGNNVLGQRGVTRDTLIRELADLARARGRRLTVVFDGPPDHGRPKVQQLGDVTIVHAAPRSADEEIVRRVREARDPRGVTVVTDDRVLCESVDAAGGRTQPVAAFRQTGSHRLRKKAAEGEDKQVPGGSASEWTRWFSDPRNRIG